MGTAAASAQSRSERLGMITCLVTEARALSPSSAVRDIAQGFKDNDLLTYASAIAFQVFFALVPLTLVGLGLLGAFGLSDVWSNDVAPGVRDNVSPAAFQVINDTVTKILGARHLFWVTLGAVIAVWEISGAMRATMQVLNRVYGVSEERSFRKKLWESMALSTVVAALMLLAVAATKGGPALLQFVFGDGWFVSALTFVASWAISIALLFFVVTLVVRFAPDTRRPVRWANFGALLVIIGWVVMSLVYGWYVSSVADYGSIFGSLAVVMVTLTYLYMSAIVFLTGLQLDSLIRHQVEEEGDAACERRGDPLIEGATGTLLVARSVTGPVESREVEAPDLESPVAAHLDTASSSTSDDSPILKP
jgi:membrane protein